MAVASGGAVLEAVALGGGEAVLVVTTMEDDDESDEAASFVVDSRSDSCCEADVSRGGAVEVGRWDATEVGVRVDSMSSCRRAKGNWGAAVTVWMQRSSASASQMPRNDRIMELV